VRKNALDLSRTETLVLDEADRLFSLGFGDELAEILALLPGTETRQTLLFSATFPPKVRAFASALLRCPVRIAVAPQASSGSAVLPNVEQRAIEVDIGKRTQLLRHLLTEEGFAQVLVFVASRHGADHLVSKLTAKGFSVTRPCACWSLPTSRRAGSIFRSCRR
jgi:ATP-dependent RNA helicase RhlE